MLGPVVAIPQLSLKKCEFYVYLFYPFSYWFSVPPHQSGCSWLINRKMAPNLGIVSALSVSLVLRVILLVTFLAADKLTLTRIIEGKDQTENTTITSTELCDEQQFSDFVEELGSCRLEAESIVDQVRKILIH